MHIDFLKKVQHLEAAEEKRHFLRSHREKFVTVQRGCQMLGISVFSYYYKPKRDPNLKATADMDLRDRIEEIQVEFPRYRYRRIQQHLKREELMVTANGSVRSSGSKGFLRSSQKSLR